MEKTPEEFIKRFNALCEECGYRIVVTPYLEPTKDGSWALKLKQAVKLLPKK